MGNVQTLDTTIAENPERKVFVTFLSLRSINSSVFGTIVVFKFALRYRRFQWEVELRFNEITRLDKSLLKRYPEFAQTIQRPNKASKFFWTHDHVFLQQRAKALTKYLQEVVDALNNEIFENSDRLRNLLQISRVSFNPDWGKKGKEGYLKKCSGGFKEKFSSKVGDYINLWNWRWVVLTDTAIHWYHTPQDTSSLGTLQIDQQLHVMRTGRVITVSTGTRKLALQASTLRSAEEWHQELLGFYETATRRVPHPFESSYPPRPNTEVKVYTYPRDYFSSAAVALLGAQKEIMIACWKNSPTVLLTRPPMPPLRLDQILKYKADQGVKVYVLLYKEVENVGQSNASGKAKNYLESLSKNILCIRHPNKFMGGSTAIWWSHHEKLLVIDRNIAFVGGIDLTFQRYDDEFHRAVDEDGLFFPGLDYRQPAPGLFKPVRDIKVQSAAQLQTGDDALHDIEVEALSAEEVQVAGYATATATTAAGTSSAAEVEVEVLQDGLVQVVDFGVVPDYAASAAVIENMHGNTYQPYPGRASASGFSSASADSPTAAAQRFGVSASGSGDTFPAGTGRPDSLNPEELDDDMDQMSDVSENWAEDRNQAETAEEREARLAAEQSIRPEESSKPTTPRSRFRGAAKHARQLQAPTQTQIRTHTQTQTQAVSVSTSGVVAGAGAVTSYRVDQRSVSSISTVTAYPSAGASLDASLDGSAPAGTGEPLRGTQYSTVTSSFISDRNGNSSSSSSTTRSSFVSKVEFMMSSISEMTAHIKNSSGGSGRGNFSSDSAAATTEIVRSAFPRMSWHDVQAAVCGQVARDVSSHFVQRWNHHRLSAYHYTYPILGEITDDTAYSLCARCKAEKIDEILQTCPNCGYDLGPVNSFCAPVQDSLLPTPLPLFSYIVFSCSYVARLPFRMQGDCPVVVTALLEAATIVDGMQQGSLVDLAGPMAEQLTGWGLTPAIGDVVLAVDQMVVTHLDYNQLKRLIAKRRAYNRLHSSGGMQAAPSSSASASAEDLPALSSEIERGVDMGREAGLETVDGTVSAFSVGSNCANAAAAPAAAPVVEVPISILFRRHYVEGLHPLDAKLAGLATGAEVSAAHSNSMDNLKSHDEPASSPTRAATASPPIDPPSLRSAANAPAGAPPASSSSAAAGEENVIGTSISAETGLPSSPSSPPAPSYSVPSSVPSAPAPGSCTPLPSVLPPAAVVTPIADEEAVFGKTGSATAITGTSSGLASASVSASAGSGGVGRLGEGGSEGEDLGGEGAPVVAAISVSASHREMASSGLLVDTGIETGVGVPTGDIRKEKDKAGGGGAYQKDFHPMCTAAALQEIRLSMSQLFHNQKNYCDPISRLGNNGSCVVQTLRSVGKWSIGTKTECSIMNAWIEAIKYSQKLIYIENQFFVGGLAGEDVSNGIPGAILDRILSAHSHNQPFRVIVVIPMHPNGDYSSAKKAQVVMHYEYQTINRGVSSMLQQLQRRAPGINVEQYIGFYSLRSWGVLNNKVVSCQVYVHDKLLVVDDRILIIGSANINDRSMLGHRDSEMAIRIEDTLHMDVMLGGQPFRVGFLPHSVRMRLMKQHLATDAYDLTDIVSPEVYTLWRQLSARNSSVYDELDGNMSMYRVETVSGYKRALRAYTPKSYLDPMVQLSMSEIKGFLVDWPHTLLAKEDLSPSLATRAIVPNEMWV